VTFLRPFWLAAAALLLSLLCPARAFAATDVCAAEPALLVPLHRTASDDAYGYVLHASAPRTVSGHLEIYAGSTTGYEVAFQNVELHRAVHQLYRSDSAPFLRYVDYESAPLYFSLPLKAAISDVWVGHAKFEKSPDVECPASPYDLAEARQSLVETLRNEGGANPSAIRGGAPPALPAASAVPMPERGCGAAYTPPALAQAQPASYPQNLNYSSNGPIDVISKVLVGPDRQVRDAWLFGGSGYVAFDAEGLRAAAHSKYRSATFLCQHVPSVFIYVQRF